MARRGLTALLLLVGVLAIGYAAGQEVDGTGRSLLTSPEPTCPGCPCKPKGANPVCTEPTCPEGTKLVKGRCIVCPAGYQYGPGGHKCYKCEAGYDLKFVPHQPPVCVGCKPGYHKFPGNDQWCYKDCEGSAVLKKIGKIYYCVTRCDKSAGYYVSQNGKYCFKSGQRLAKKCCCQDPSSLRQADPQGRRLMGATDPTEQPLSFSCKNDCEGACCNNCDTLFPQFAGKMTEGNCNCFVEKEKILRQRVQVLRCLYQTPPSISPPVVKEPECPTGTSSYVDNDVTTCCKCETGEFKDGECPAACPTGYDLCDGKYPFCAPQLTCNIKSCDLFENYGSTFTNYCSP